MVSLAASHAARQQLGAECLVADAQSLPESFGGSFDRVVASLCYHIVPDHLQV
jgi:hypothetical protein